MELCCWASVAATSIDVIGYFEKIASGCDGCVVEVSAERSDDAPKVFTKIMLHYTVTGRNLKQNFVDRLRLKLSTEKIRSASIMLGKKNCRNHT